MLSIHDADMVAKMVAEEFGVPPPPPIYASADLNPKYAAAFYYNGKQLIKVRPQYMTEGTIAHEVGHYIYHVRRPGECKHGENPECEEVAQMIEKWWVHKRKREGTWLG